jgi:hypothetical protein
MPQRKEGYASEKRQPAGRKAKNTDNRNRVNRRKKIKPTCITHRKVFGRDFKYGIAFKSKAKIT